MLGGDTTGDLVSIDRGELRELYVRLGEAVGAIERGNNRINGWKRLWACTDAIWRTGQAPAQCDKAP